ncbi:MAG: HAMP domain-containing histidine kinase [Gemmatimonadetes bacterium]|nr:HAMP domain-containing histidine kinase [Gemmatimonadota bacterium]
MALRRPDGSTIALGASVVGMAAATVVADRAVAATGATTIRMALWLITGATMFALAAAVVIGRRRARRNAERSRDLEELSAQLYRANRAKAEFLASASHELRTPLAAIVGFVDLLHDGSYGALTARQKGPVERIESSAKHLHDMVEQILDLARMAAGRLDVNAEPVRLRPFVIDVASEMEPLAAQHGLSFTISVPATLPTIVTDVSHLRRILVNLIGNAIKFTPRGGVAIRAVMLAEADVARVTATMRRRPMLGARGSWVALHVQDTGIGIAPADAERIFEEFEQVNAGSRGDSEHRGTGLGLAISRRLARLLSGDVTLESAEGKGSTFTVWLPVDGGPAV